jgi:putative ABC transport system substrate-binding protein
VNLDNASMARLLGDLKSAGASLKVELHQFEARHSSEFEGALKAISERRMEAVMVADDALFVGDSGPLARGISGRRMPSIGFIELAESGGLMAYGVDFPALYRRAAQFVDKILKGAHPGEIPIQRATTFILVVNMKSAKALGITIPQAVLIRADKVIE